MRKPCFAALTSLGLLIAGFGLSAALADESKGRCKVYTLDNRVLEGDVKEDGDSYVIERSKGITVRLKKTEVRKLEAISEASNTEPGSTGGSSLRRRAVTNEEIAEILGSDDVELSELDPSATIDLMKEIPLDPSGLQEMFSVAGPKAKHLLTKHFVIVYTSETDAARRLAARLDSVYEWCAKLANQLELQKRLPRYKLEIYYFGTFDEYDKYQTVMGLRNVGFIGFYSHVNNRSAFFDMLTWPPFAQQLEAARQPGVDAKTRLGVETKIGRLVEHNNFEVVQHEAAHHVHYNIGIFTKFGDTPRWMSEGLATMFEVPPSGSGGSLGSLNHTRLYNFRRVWGEKGERLPDMKTFLLNDGLFFQLGWSGYLIGWTVNQYLYRTQPDKFKQWMQLLGERESYEEVSVADRLAQFEDIFGEVNDIWVKKYIDYIASLELRRDVLPPEWP